MSILYQHAEDLRTDNLSIPPPLEVFRTRLDEALSSLTQGEVSLPWQGAELGDL